jgi:hypothetical protein
VTAEKSFERFAQTQKSVLQSMSSLIAATNKSQQAVKKKEKPSA